MSFTNIISVEKLKGGAYMLGRVDVGGGIRGVYSSGIYDAFLDEGFTADYCIGVSAGATFGCNFKSRQNGKTF